MLYRLFLFIVFTFLIYYIFLSRFLFFFFFFFYNTSQYFRPSLRVAFFLHHFTISYLVVTVQHFYSNLILHISPQSPCSIHPFFSYFLQPIFIIGKRISDIKGYYFTLLDEKESVTVTPILETLLAKRSASGIAPTPQKVSEESLT